MDRRRRGPPPPPPSSFSSEQLRIDEVRYLHSLWYQGPPQNPNPNNNNNNNLRRPSNPPIFKKKKRGRSRNRHNRNKEEQVQNEPVSEVEWPTEPIPEPREEIGWPDSVPQPNSSSTTRVLSAEEQEKYKGVQSQNKAFKASKRFLSSNFGSDNEAVVDEDEDDFMEDDDYDDDNDCEDSEEFKFFLNLFTEDGELRNYYEKNWEGGDFPCFVCGVSGRKCGKRFKNCISLVHHSSSITSRKRRRAHRAFGQVLCRVMGWEFKRLPTIVLSAGGPLSGVLVQAGSSQVADDENSNKVVDSINADIVGGDQKEEFNVNCAEEANGNSAECEVADDENSNKVVDSINADIVGGDQKEEFNVNYAGEANGNSAECEVADDENSNKVVDSGNAYIVGGDQKEELNVNCAGEANGNSAEYEVADDENSNKVVDSGNADIVGGYQKEQLNVNCAGDANGNSA